MTELFRRIRYLLSRRRMERELSEEMAAHREMMAEGKPPAMSHFGMEMRLIESSREVWGWCWLDRLFQDLRYGVRVLGRSPTFSLTAILVLTLGIGVNLTAFRMVLLETTPTVRDPDTLVQLDRWFPDGHGSTIAYPVLAFYARQSRSFEAVVAAHEESIVFGDTLSGRDPETLKAAFVTANFFTEQGPPIVHGRMLAAGLDESANAEPAALLTQTFWQRRLGADPNILGKTLRLNGKSVRVVGILGDSREHRVDVWMVLAKQPAIVDGSTILVDWKSPTAWGTARLKPGVNVRAAEEESRMLAAALRESHPEAVGKDERLTLTPFSSHRMHPQEVVVAAIAVALVMLILVVACANLGLLLLARGVAREREIRTRLALGASRLRVVRQLLTESTLLAVAGSLVAFFVSALSTRVFLTQADHQRIWAVALDWRVIAGTVVIALFAAAVFGIAPAFRLTGYAPHDGRAKAVFLAAQVSASCVLLMISSQLIRSFTQLLQLDPAFDFQKVLIISPGLRSHGYEDAAAIQYFEKLRERLSAMPYVEHASVTWLPVWGNVSSGFLENGRKVAINRVDADFVATLGLRLSRGRNFANGERDAAVVSESFARWQWPGEDPIGKRLTVPVTATVRGVVTKAGTFDAQDADAMGVYYPITAPDYSDASIVIRVGREPGRFAGVLIGVASALDRRLRPDFSLLRTAHEKAIDNTRSLASVLSLLSLLATLLAAVGIAGLTAYTVGQRTREIGIRKALGAARLPVVLALLRPLMIPVAAGIVFGLLVAGAISAALRNNLSSLRPADPIAYLMAIATFVFTVALAVLVPVRRAAQIQPAEALRHEL